MTVSLPTLVSILFITLPQQEEGEMGVVFSAGNSLSGNNVNSTCGRPQRRCQKACQSCFVVGHVEEGDRYRIDEAYVQLRKLIACAVYLFVRLGDTHSTVQ